MTLHSYGSISISQIRAELGSSSYSLRTLSSAAGKGTPDAMSEFYGYSFQFPGYTWYFYNSSDWGEPPEFWGYYDVYGGYSMVGPLYPGESASACVRQGTQPETGSSGDNPWTSYETC